MAFMLAYLNVPLSWREIVRRTFHEAFVKDNCLGMAAQLSYYFLFALFPTLLVVMAIADIFAADVIQMIRGTAGLVPREGISLITEQLGKLSDGEQGGLLTLGMLTALWSSSAAMTAIIDTLNSAYDIEEGRPWWKVRLTAILLTIGVALFILISFALIVMGPTVARWIEEATPLGSAFTWTWMILQWPIVFAIVSIGFAIVYYYAPDAEQDWVWLTPGSILATTLWLIASLGFKFYIANFSSYTETYGAIGGVMVLMLWFYISGLVILFGAELNAEIEHASPYGKDEGEKVPGEKQKIGPARMRAWMEKQKKGAGPATDAPGDPTVVRPFVPAPARAAAGSAGGGFMDRLLGAGIVLAQAFLALKSIRRTRA